MKTRASKVVGDLGELLALPADLDAAWVDRMDGGGGGDGTGEDGDVVAGDDFVVEEEAPGFHKEEEAPADGDSADPAGRRMAAGREIVRLPDRRLLLPGDR